MLGRCVIVKAENLPICEGLSDLGRVAALEKLFYSLHGRTDVYFDKKGKVLLYSVTHSSSKHVAR